MSEKENNKDIEIELEELEIETDISGAEAEKLGEIIAASTDEGITIKIIDRPDKLKLGQPMIMETDQMLYYCIIQVLYYPTNPVSVAERFANSPFIDLIPPSDIEGVRGKEFYALADLSCVKIIELKKVKKGEEQSSLREFDTIPPIFSTGRNVGKDEINTIYQKKKASESVGFLRGFPEYDIPIDFELLVKKPYGIFGKTGLGKSILNKLLCLNILKHDVSQILLFDMQGEYGLTSRADNTKGLKFYYPDKVKIYRLGELEGKKKTIDDAEPFVIYKENIDSGDIIASSQTLREPTINVLLKIEDNLGKDENLLDGINNADADALDINRNSLRALQNRIIPFNRYDFLQNKGERKREDSIQDIFTQLVDGKSIITDFGKYGINRHLYFFIANMITRRLYREYSNREFSDEDLPPLVIVLEEAHKFLQSRVIQHTIFDRIAREMRKFQLTLAFIDQRPSQIDEEVFSQVANRFTLGLTDPKDMDCVVGILPNPKKWRQVIAGLQQRECFIFGDAIAVPTIIEVMDYNKVNIIKKKLEMKETLTEIKEKIKATDMTKIFPNKE